MFKKEKYISYKRQEKNGQVYEYYNIMIRKKSKIIFNKCLNIKCYTEDEVIKIRDDFLQQLR